MKQEKFEKVVKWEEGEYDFNNILGNLICTIIAGILYLIFDFEFLFIVILFFDFFYFILMLISNRKVYWVKVK